MLYFYVGHACPDFGDANDVESVVLAIGAETSDSEAIQATLTPFDSGGFYLSCVATSEQRYVHFRTGHDPRDADPLAYIRGRTRSADPSWREEFRGYLRDHFPSVGDYMRGGEPTRDDDDGRLRHPDNERRAWTWEMQVPIDHDMRDGLVAMWMSSDRRSKLRAAIHGHDDGAQRDRWLSVWHRVRQPQGDSYPFTMLCELAEQELAKWLTSPTDG